jgi:hypothetical protein
LERYFSKKNSIIIVLVILFTLSIQLSNNGYEVNESLAQNTTMHSAENTTMHSAENTTMHSAENTTMHSAENTNADPLNIIEGVIALSNENKGLERDLGNLANYEAPVFVWDEIVLEKGENRSDLLKQTPIKLQDGRIEDNKAIEQFNNSSSVYLRFGG